MSTDTARIVFALLCTVGLIAIITGSLVEGSKMRRGQSAISSRHFHWRMLSALVWILILGSLLYATIFLWPANPLDRVAVRRFGGVIAGSMMMMMVAMLLFVFDVWLTFKERQIHQMKFRRELESPARAEIEKILKQHASQNGAGADER